MNKRLIAVILSICMFFTMLPMTAAAEEAGAVASGSCGAQVNWTLASDGTLTISGSGAMDNYRVEEFQPSDNREAPWYANRENITRIVVEDGVDQIGDYAFVGCMNVNEVTFSDTVMDFGFKTFKGCTRLTHMRIPANVKYLRGCLFEDCSSLQEVTIPDGMTEIGSSAFEGCSSLQELAIPLSVIKIGDAAFEDCSSLREMVIPAGVTRIPGSVFSGCSNLQNVVIPSEVTELGGWIFRGCENLQEFAIPSAVTEIKQYTFEGCSSLQELVIPSGVTQIGDGAFRDCSGIQEMIIPENVTVIGESVFSGCSNLQSVMLPSGIKEIPRSLFLRCSKLQSITIPEEVTRIAGNAFEGCSSLQELVIPSKVKSIADSAFAKCSGLREIIIPEGVSKIWGDTFEGCSSLQNVVLPKSLTEIASCAFRDCIALKEIIVPSSVVTIGTIVFMGTKNLTLVGAKGSAIETYAKENGHHFEEHAHEWDDGDKSNLNCANNKVTYTCTVCGAVEEREMTVPHSEIVVANELGNICSGIEGKAYYKCVLCGRYFLDQSGNAEITLEDIREEAAHSLTKVEEIQATCEIKGSIEHYKCEKCGKLFRDADAAEEIRAEDVVIEKSAHSLVKEEEVQATCTTEGSIAYYTCENCGKLFRDAGGAEEIRAEDLVIEKSAHSLVKEEGVQATCTAEGRIAYYTCENCRKLFRDADGAQEITLGDTKIEKLGHSIVKVEANPASCAQAGSIEHYKCGRCGKLYRDMGGLEEITPDEIYTEKSGHSLVEVAAKLPACEEEGHLAYYRCESCGKQYRDADGLEELAAEEIIIKPLGHSLWRVEAKKATCTQKGNIEYFYCEDCGKKFSDMSGSKQISKVEVNPLGHKYLLQTAKANFSSDGGTVNICQNCGHKVPINTYYRISTLQLSQVTYRYNGKVQTPKVIVKDSKGTNIPDINYTVSYANKKSKNIGKYKVTVRFKGNMYTGMKTLNYTILPPNIALKSVSASAEGQIKVKWGAKKNIDGYQVRYSAKSSMKGSKTKKVKGAKTKQVTLKKLAKGKKYYVQVRGYKKVSGKIYYGAWSKKKSAKTLNIRLNYKSLSLEPGQTVTLKLLGAKSPIVWKSSNPAVASVNSAGKVTAVADGAATVTAECQGRAYSCTVSVKTVTNFDRLYNYINLMGDVNSSGSRFISYSFYVEGELWKTGIVYDHRTNQFQFICSGPDKALISMKIGRNGSTAAECEFLYAGSYYMFCEASTFIEVASFTNNTKLNFIFKEYSGAPTEMYNELANAELRVGMSAWSILLKKKLGFGMSGLGFTSYN